jgi:hydrogenase nickel incorporation protein HypA/HybF
VRGAGGEGSGMHELSIASQIWGSVARAARQHGGGRVVSIKLELGELNLIEEEQLRFWIEELGKRDGSPEVRLEITTVKGRVHCNECGAEGEPGLPEGSVDHFVPLAMSCRACGSRNVVVAGGRELRVVTAEIEKEGSDGSKG